MLWKLNENLHNGIHFEDRRFISFDEQVIDNYIFLSELINDMPFKPEIYTNDTTFRDMMKVKILTIFKIIIVRIEILDNWHSLFY